MLQNCFKLKCYLFFFFRKHNHPADPVSLSLAFKAEQRSKISVPEAKLQYGFRKKPKNHQKVKHHSKIDEEKLYACEKEVVELKKPNCAKEEFDDDEHDDEDEEHEEEEESHHSPSHLGYSDIGYFPEKKHHRKFMTHHHHEDHSCKDPLPLPEIGNCGFKRGEVIQEDDRKHDSKSAEENFRYDHSFIE